MQQGIKTPTPLDPITQTEYKLIVQKAQESQTLRGAVDVACIGLMRDGLLRPREAAAARWSDLQRQEDGSSLLTIRPSEADRSGEPSLVYISPTTTEALDEMCRIKEDLDMDTTDDRIFQMSVQRLRRHIRNACEAAGLPGRYGATSPRIGMVMDLLSSGVDTVDLMQAARLKTLAIPYHLMRNIPAGYTAVAPWYARQMRDAASE